MKTDTRYPYTYACDFVREFSSEWREVAGVNMKLPSISRGQASSIMGAFEAVFGLTHEEMATKLADYSNAREAA
jgi:hypothetical protein